MVREVSTEFRLDQEPAKAPATNGQDRQTAAKTVLELLEAFQKFRARNSNPNPVPFL
jgi:hypothetical protein